MNFKFVLPALAVSFIYTCSPKIVFANSCRDIFPVTGEVSYFDRKAERQEIEWKSDSSYIRGYLEDAAKGSMKDFFSERWDTRIYFTGTGTYKGKNQQEDHLVDPDAKAVFLFFHGSGTVKASGKNFFGLMNTLNSLGFSAVSFDMPFHSDGPTKDAFNNLDYTMKWMKNILETLKKSGKPVILVGHSFGPDMILELNTRYPELVNDVVPISPAGFTKELQDWYENYTVKMKFGGEVMPSELGGAWAGRMAEQLTWSKGVYKDPTLVNPNLRITVLSGDREEYVPAPVGGPGKTPVGKNTYDISVPLKKIFSRVQVEIAEGVGHYLFDYKDKQGRNFILKHLLEKAGMEYSQIKQVSEQTSELRNLKDPVWKITDLYQNDPMFRAWLADQYGGSERAQSVVLQMAKKPDQYGVIAKKLVTEWPMAKKSRDQKIIADIKATKTTHPAFYSKFKERIEQSDTSMYPDYLNMVLLSTKK